jgi:hypothetical protein
MILSFADVFAAAMGKDTGPASLACVDALRTADIPMDDLRVLRATHRRLQEPYSGARPGDLVVAVLRAQFPDAIRTWAFMVSNLKLNDRRAQELHGDCYLALDRWRLTWNRGLAKRPLRAV